jgi:hypothetical protein
MQMTAPADMAKSFSREITEDLTNINQAFKVGVYLRGTSLGELVIFHTPHEKKACRHNRGFRSGWVLPRRTSIAKRVSSIRLWASPNFECICPLATRESPLSFRRGKYGRSDKD